MPSTIAMPKLGMTMREGTVVEWRAQVGERVDKGAVILVIESEKAEIEVEATSAGFLRHVYVDAGEIVPCGTLLAVLTEASDDDFDAEAFRTAFAPVAAKGPASERAPGLVHEPSEGVAPAANVRASDVPATPAARRLARERSVDLSRVVGSGPGGRITREDVEEWSERLAARIETGPGVALELLTRGNGEPVLLLPGFGTDISAFAPVLPALSKTHRVLALNPRGIGLSAAPDAERYDLATAAQDAAAVLGDTSAHIVGASLGAGVAIELALSQPRRVRSLTLITPFVVVTGRLRTVMEAWHQISRSGDRQALACFVASWMFSERFLGDDTRRARTLRALEQTVATTSAETLSRWAAGLSSWSGARTGSLTELAPPTLVLAAGDDLLVPDATAVAQAIPHAKLVVIDGAGHALTVEAPERVSAEILAHIDSV